MSKPDLAGQIGFVLCCDSFYQTKQGSWENWSEDIGRAAIYRTWMAASNELKFLFKNTSKVYQSNFEIEEVTLESGDEYVQ